MRAAPRKETRRGEVREREEGKALFPPLSTPSIMVVTLVSMYKSAELQIREYPDKTRKHKKIVKNSLEKYEGLKKYALAYCGTH